VGFLKEEIKERIEMISRGEVPEGYKKTKVGIIPEDWEVKRFGQEFKVNQGLQIPIKDRHRKKVQGSYVYITNDYINNLNDGYEVEYIKDPSKTVICTSRDILMTRTGNTGIVVTGVEGVFHNNFFKVKYDDRKHNYMFIVYLFKSSQIQHDISRLAGTSTIPDLTHSDFYSLESAFPPLPEQKKIAQILSTWDKAIELKEQLIEEKKEQKKGLMQRLLTGEDRLPGYNEEWEEIRLGDIGQTFNGLSGKSAKDFGEGKPFITYKNIFDNSRVDIEEVDYVEVSENENQNIAKYGDIFFTTSSETPDEVGMSSVLLDEVEELYLNSFCFGYRLYDFETLIPEYARFLFRGKTFRNKIFKLAQGSTRFNISKNEVMKLNIKLPLLQEQKAIAQVLSTADKEIELLEEELEQLKLQKKGLMQLLLTGIIRVQY
jgi:type I restriction enzyme S subunit